ncbi:MAG: NAD(P)/FAD-dependent oxidoreductase [Saprospiraceae bacterium]
MKHNVTIVGAGLCGSLLAITLAQRGMKVRVFEKRRDARKHGIYGGRSINLALSDRGLAGLHLAGLENEVREISIPMKGRKIHGTDHSLHFLPYSGRNTEWINSISRQALNHKMLDKLDAYENVDVYFEYECADIDIKTNTVNFSTINGEIKVQSDVIFGTDGANSAVRQAYMRHSAAYQFNYSQHFLEAGYKELEMPPSVDGGFRIDKNALHIWPRKGIMMIALPNLDGSFTVTLFMPLKGDNSFEKLKTRQDVEVFFKSYFPDALEHMPDVVDDFFTNPTSSLHTVKCFPWQLEGKMVLLGDAAHAVVPFYGQGMNASFEDVLVLNQILDNNPIQQNWEKILDEFQIKRKKNTDAIADLAVDNFYEMRDATANPVFLRKREIEVYLEQNYPNYYSKYSMVTFREDLSYYDAMVKGRNQDKILMDYASKLRPNDQINYEEIIRILADV